LAIITAKTLVIGISTDILFPPQEQAKLAELINDAKFIEIESNYGHDGFLIEFEAMTSAIKDWAK
jgi:homoserine O-acetyltransferase/O-succinyltransferase